MPQRTINDAYFQYRDTNGVLIYAQRGETVDIPEGEDLERGDKFGAFTSEVTEEVTPPEGSKLVDINLEKWVADDYQRFVDAGQPSEILAKLAEIDPVNQPRVAQNLLEAEASRPKRNRKKLIEQLTEIAGGEAAGDGELDPDGAEAPSLETFVEQNSVDKVLAKAGDDPEAAKALRLAEEARGSRARSTLIEALAKIEG